MSNKLTIMTVLEAAGREDAFLETISDLRRAPSPVQGYGMYSTRMRRAGELLCKLDGQVVDAQLYPELMAALEWNALSERLLLVRAVRTSYGYINHAADPNVAIDADGYHLRTIREIAADEELLLDYLAPPVPPGYLASAEGKALALGASAARPQQRKSS